MSTLGFAAAISDRGSTFEPNPLPPPQQGYATIALSPDGGSAPIAYWRFGSTESIIDSVASFDGTYDGSGRTLVSGLASNSDNAINFGGTDKGTVPHNAAFAVATFTLPFFVTVHAFPASGNCAIISKDQSGLNVGDFSVILTEAGELGVLFQSATNQHLITLPIQLGTKYHVCVQANNTGFWLYLNAKFIEKNTGFTGALTSNTLDWRFATVPWSAQLANVTLDEAPFYDYLVTEAGIAALAEKTAAPTAVADVFSVSVPEDATTILDVVANDDYVGQKANLTVELWNGAAWISSISTTHGTATVRADKRIDYTADPVSGDQSDSFLYRIIDANGASAGATVSLTVHDSTIEAANLFVSTTGNDNNPGTEAQPFRTIQKALNVAGPGDTIEVAPGTYQTATWTNSGTSNNPITLRAKFPASTTALANRSRITGNSSGANLHILNKSHVVVDGLYFNGGAGRAITFGSSGATISGGMFQNLRIEQPDPNHSYTNGILITRCNTATVRDNVFLDLGTPGAGSNPVMDYAVILNFPNSNVDVLNNYFYGRFHQCISFKHNCHNCRAAFNTFDGSQLTAIFVGQQDDGTSGVNNDHTNTDNIVEYNHFRDAKDSQNREHPLGLAIAIKNASGTIVRYNLIERASVGITHHQTAHTGGYYSIGGGTVSFGVKPLNDKWYGNVLISCDIGLRLNGQGYSNDNVFVWNNTFFNCTTLINANPYPSARTDSWIETYNPPPTQFYNNNVSGTGSPSGTLTQMTWRNNNFHNSGGAKHASDLTVNPQFVGTPSAHTPGPPNPVFQPNFSKVALLKLQSGSPLRNAGIDVGLVPNPPPDIGHNEFTYP